MHDPPPTVAKVLGADFELANSFLGERTGTTGQAAGMLLAQIDGYPRRGQGRSAIEYGRRFLDTCGSSWYIDSDHLEGNLIVDRLSGLKRSIYRRKQKKARAGEQTG